MTHFNDYIVSTDKSKLDINLIHNFLTNSYWANGISLDLVRKRINNSLCFGIYKENNQLGFARVITDFVTLAYLLDVFILESERGKGLSKILLNYIFSYEDLKDIKKWMLSTKDAHKLYAKYGFHPLENSEKLMEKNMV